MEDDTDEEDMENINLDKNRYRHWSMVFEYNDGGVDDAKALLHAKKWDICVNDKENIVNGGYSLEVVGHEKKEVLW